MTVAEMKNAIEYLHTILGIPYKFIADKAEMSNTHLTLWLRGDKNLSEQAFKRVCKYYEDFRKEVEIL